MSSSESEQKHTSHNWPLIVIAVVLVLMVVATALVYLASSTLVPGGTS